MKIADVKAGTVYLYTSRSGWMRSFGYWSSYQHPVRIDDPAARYSPINRYGKPPSWESDPKGLYLKGWRTDITPPKVKYVMARFLVDEFAECERQVTEVAALQRAAEEEREVAASAAAERAAELRGRLAALGIENVTLDVERWRSPHVIVKLGQPGDADGAEQVLAELLDRIEAAEAGPQRKPRGRLRPVCMIPDCGCTGYAHP